MSSASNGPQPCYLCGRSTTRLVVANAGYSYVACSSCGFRRRDPLPTAEEEDHLYLDEYYLDRRLEADLDHQPQLMRDIIDDRVKILTELNGAPGRLLDLGAGTGLFVEASRRAGWNSMGVETSAAAVRIAGTITRAPVVMGRIEDLSLDGSLDAVTLWDVLEHVHDPRATLGAIGRHLRPDGLVGISLPNVGGLKARVQGNRWRYYQRSFGHLSHFSPRTMAKLLAQAGYKIERLTTTGSFNLGKPFRLDPVAVRERHAGLSAMQGLADGAVSRLGVGESLVAFARRVLN